MKDLVIIGGGPAGLAAGLYAGRAKLDVLLLEKGAPGGLAATTEGIENYPGFPEGVGGPDLMEKMLAQAQKFGLEVKSAAVESISWANGHFQVKTEDEVYPGLAVILATGAEPELLHVPGETEFRGRGVSYCATCDGAFFRGKTVAVVGGGDAAVEEAVFLTRFAEKVYLIHRRGELRATKVVQQKAMVNPRIEFIWHNVVEEIFGGKTVEGMQVKDVRSGEKRRLDVDGVFIYVGQKPASRLVKELVELDPRGYIITDENMQTSFPGLFAAGDVRKKLLRQVVTAVADGAVAAVAAEKYVEELKGHS
jgi:thioredoxin reductase (NADPH)